MNTVTHRSHRSFARALGINIALGGAANEMRGEIIYHPTVIAPSGKTGLYRFEFQPNDSYSFKAVQLGFELMAANMPFLENNLVYYPMPNAALPLYHQEKELYDSSRVAILFEEDLFTNVQQLAVAFTTG